MSTRPTNRGGESIEQRLKMKSEMLDASTVENPKTAQKEDQS
jgi:hypothetical protein